MKKIILSIFYIIFFTTSAISEDEIKRIYEGSPDAKIQLIVYESLTCSHCADFHNNVYPKLKENFIDQGHVKIEFRNFPLDMAALNASKIAHCKNDGKSDILHFLFKKQKEWTKGSEIEDINSNLIKILDSKKYEIDFNKWFTEKNDGVRIVDPTVSGRKMKTQMRMISIIKQSLKEHDEQEYKKFVEFHKESTNLNEQKS